MCMRSLQPIELLHFMMSNFLSISSDWQQVHKKHLATPTVFDNFIDTDVFVREHVELS